MAYTMEPGRFNPEATLYGAWIVRNDSGLIIARFDTDGRDKAEAFIHYRTINESRDGHVIIGWRDSRVCIGDRMPRGKIGLVRWIGSQGVILA